MHHTRTRTLATPLLIVAAAMLLIASTALAQRGIDPDHLTIVVQTYPDGIDPHQCAYNNCFVTSHQLGDTLVVRLPEGGFGPHLATDWAYNEEGTSVTFTLREDVTFHDGTRFDADAVKRNFERVAADETASRLARAYLGPFDSAEVIDDFTVRINFTQRHAPFFNYFASYIAMLSPTAFDATPLAEFNWAPVGTGPWMVERHVPRDRVDLVRNPDYNWPAPIFESSGPPAVERLTIRFIQEDATRAAVLETGEAQAIWNTPPASLPGFKAQSDRYWVEETVMAGPGIHYVLNMSRAPLDDVLVRQALIYGTDQEMINATVFLGQGNIARQGIVSPYTPCYDEAANTLYQYDPERAAELLDEAGWTLNAAGVRTRDGERLTIVINSVAVGSGPEIGEVLQAQWSALGIDARNQTLATAGIQVDVAQRAEFDVMWRDFGANDPNILSTLFHTRNAGPGQGWNFNHQTTLPELDALLDEGDLETDPDARCAIYAEAQMMINENAMIIPVRWREGVLTGLHAVQGVRMDQTGIAGLRLYDARIVTD